MESISPKQKIDYPDERRITEIRFDLKVSCGPVEQARCKRLTVNQHRAGFDSLDRSQMEFDVVKSCLQSLEVVLQCVNRRCL